MQLYPKSTAIAKQVPNLVQFGGAVLECMYLQSKWQFKEKFGPILVMQRLKKKGVPKQLAQALAVRYEQSRFFRYVSKKALPKNGIYGPQEKLDESLQRITLHFFMKPENLVRAAFVVARHGEQDSISGCYCHTNHISTTSPRGLGKIRINFAESENPGDLMGVSVTEVFGDSNNPKILYSLAGKRVTHQSFTDVGADWCIKVLDAARQLERPQDRAAWTGVYAKRFGFA